MIKDFLALLGAFVDDEMPGSIVKVFFGGIFLICFVGFAIYCAIVT